MAKIKTAKKNVIGKKAILREFAINVAIAGGEVNHVCDNCVEYVFDDSELDIETANFVNSVEDTIITDYYIKRWIEVSNVDAEIPVGFPNSSDPDGNQLFWRDVIDEGTLKIGEFYYPEVGYVFNGNPKGITLEEFNNINLKLLTADEVNSLKDISNESESDEGQNEEHEHRTSK